MPTDSDHAPAATDTTPDPVTGSGDPHSGEQTDPIARAIATVNPDEALRNLRTLADDSDGPDADPLGVLDLLRTIFAQLDTLLSAGASLPRDWASTPGMPGDTTPIDPDSTLRRMRDHLAECARLNARAQAAEDDDDHAAVEEIREQAEDACSDAVTAADELDAWLSRGGAFPAAWTTNRVVFDATTGETLAASAIALTQDQRWAIERALAAANSADFDRFMLDTIRAVLDVEFRDDPRTAVGVLFCAGWWEDGYFLSEDGTILFDDGTTEEYDFEGVVRDALTAEFHNVGDNYHLAIDLRTDTFATDDNPDRTPHERFNIAEPPNE